MSPVWVPGIPKATDDLVVPRMCYQEAEDLGLGFTSLWVKLFCHNSDLPGSFQSSTEYVVITESEDRL